MVLKELLFNMFMLHIHKTHTILVFHASKSFKNAQTFCSKPGSLYATQNSDLFVAYTNGFNIHTGQPNPHSVINEYISGQMVLDPKKRHTDFLHSMFQIILLHLITMHISIQKKLYN